MRQYASEEERADGVGEAPWALIASASSAERAAVGRSLAEARILSLVVEDAGEAAEQVAANGGCVLVIDSGLLEAPHDGQWRLFRTAHPGLGVVIRCLIPRETGSQRNGAYTFLVHPGDVEGMQRAVFALASAPKRCAQPPARAAEAS